jgi:hypothetical protein
MLLLVPTCGGKLLPVLDLYFLHSISALNCCPFRISALCSLRSRYRQS